MSHIEFSFYTYLTCSIFSFDQIIWNIDSLYSSNILNLFHMDYGQIYVHSGNMYYFTT